MSPHYDKLLAYVAAVNAECKNSTEMAAMIEADLTCLARELGNKLALKGIDLVQLGLSTAAATFFAPGGYLGRTRRNKK